MAIADPVVNCDRPAPGETTDLSNPLRVDAPIGARFVLLRVVLVINRRLGICGVSGFRRQPSRPGVVSLRCLLAGRRSASPLHRFIERTARGRVHWCPLRSFCAVRGGRGRQSWSMRVCLAVFINRATRASPLHRFIEPTARGRAHWCPFRSSAGRPRHKSAVGDLRCLGVSAVNRHGGGFFEVFTCRATQCVAPTQIYRTHCGWTRPLVTRCVPFVLSGVVAVDNRGRRWFAWRCLRTGRRVRRPYTDRPLSAPVWPTGAFHEGRSRSSLPIIGVNLRNLRFGVRGVGVVAFDMIAQP